MRVAIVGGGIAGMSSAIALEPTGSDVEVIEKEPQCAAAGAAITLRPLAVNALRRLGVLDDVVAAGRTVDNQRILAVTGETIGERILTSEGEPTIVVHRRVLQQLLADRLESTTVHMGVWPVAVNTAEQTVDVSLSNGELNRCDVLIGADGINSWLRSQLFPDATLRPVGQQYWRFCVEGELLDNWRLVTEPGRFVALLPLPGMTYCAAQVAGPALVDARVDAISALMQIFGRYPSPVADVLARVTPATEIHFGPVHEVLLEGWSAGPVGLIGDAAHALSPVLTLGGGLAIEDAVVLAEELGRGETPGAALAAFTARRRPRVELVRELANARVAAFAGAADLDEKEYQRQLAQLLEDP